MICYFPLIYQSFERFLVIEFPQISFFLYEHQKLYVQGIIFIVISLVGELTNFLHWTLKLTLGVCSCVGVACYITSHLPIYLHPLPFYLLVISCPIKSFSLVPFTFHLPVFTRLIYLSRHYSPMPIYLSHLLLTSSCHVTTYLYLNLLRLISVSFTFLYLSTCPVTSRVHLPTLYELISPV